MAKIKINPQAKKKIVKTAMEVCKDYATEVEEKMSDFFQEKIDEFYDDPLYKNRPPRQYIRHHERGFTERGLDKTYEKVLIEKSQSYEGGIRISTDDMYTKGYCGTREQVLHTFLQGLHGVDSAYSRMRTIDTVKKDVSNIVQPLIPEAISGVRPMLESREYLKELVDDIDKRMKKGGE